MKSHQVTNPNGRKVTELPLYHTRAFDVLVINFSERIGLSEPVSKSTFLTIYEQCIYENALNGWSLFCTMFNEYELKVLEYIHGLAKLTQTQQNHRLVKCNCKLSKHIYLRFSEAINHEQYSRNISHRTSTMFTHDTYVASAMGYFGVFHPPYSNESFETHTIKGDRIILDEKRPLRSSMLFPFNSNFGATLYKCSGNRFKILTTIQEVPQKIRGCKSAFCDWHDFVREYSQDWFNCDLAKLCS